MPKNKPSIVEVPPMNYIAVRGKGNPNDENGEYKESIGLLYGIAFTIKMSYKGEHKIDGYFEYVVPPLEGFWWQDSVDGIDYSHKENFSFISLIRLPDFVTKADFDWAIAEATKKKKTDFSKVEFLTYNEGLCVQCMHIGSYDDEPATIVAMHESAEQNGYELDITDARYHHEIYLSDPRKCAASKLKTVVQMVMIVVVLSSVITYFIYYYVLIPTNTTYLKTIMFILVIASLVQILEILLKKFIPSVYKALGLYLPLITTNCAVLGIALLNIDSGYNLVEMLVYSFSASLGFTLVIYIFSTIRERIEQCDVPESFKGTPIALIVAAIMALIFSRFQI